jgi:hypothetical protein
MGECDSPAPEKMDSVILLSQTEECHTHSLGKRKHSLTRGKGIRTREDDGANDPPSTSP